MNRLKYLVIGVLGLFLAGCGPGQLVRETLNVPGTNANTPGKGKSVVILPFADYSQDNLASAQYRNIIVTESLTDRLIVNGFSLPVQDDVIDYLNEENVIDVNGRSLSEELENGWSDAMQAEIKSYMTTTTNTGTHGLSTKMVSKIGKQFNADYVVRGRILEFKKRQGTSWSPSRKGFFPVINESILGAVFGYDNSDNYYDRGGDLSEMGLNRGQGAIDMQGTVQMRMWVQEAATGNVIWSNRIRVQVAPESVAADNQYDTLMHRAIDQGVTTLVDHFVTYGL